MQNISRPRGTEDLLPDQLKAMQRARNSALELARQFGYREIETPIFESTELFVRGVGDATDVVTREMYTFDDRGGRSLTLRPEGTAPTLRAFWESDLRQAPAPVRLAYAGPMFRYDRPGRGRYRQFHQVGVEAIGDSEAELDAEVIAVAWRWLAALGVGGVSLQLNSIGDADCRPAYREALVRYFQPHLQSLAPVDQERLARNPLRVLDSKEKASEELVAAAPHPIDFLCSGCREAFERVQAALQAYRIPYSLNPRLVRGLDYYVRTTFEVWHEALQGAQNSLFGGGRYDGLAELIGYPAAPGVGFAAGLERVVMVAGDIATDSGSAVFVCSAQESARAAAIVLAERLRGAGWEVVCDAGQRSLRAKMRSAEKLRAGAVCILGQEELDGSFVSVKRLADGEQVQLADDQVAGQLRSWNLISNIGRSQ